MLALLGHVPSCPTFQTFPDHSIFTIIKVKQIYFPSCLFLLLIISPRIYNFICLFQQSTFDFFLELLYRIFVYFIGIYILYVFHSILFEFNLLLLKKKTS